MGRLGVLGNSGPAFLCYEHLGVLGSKLGLEVVAVVSTSELQDSGNNVY